MFYRFANNYFGTKKPELSANWQPGDDVLDRFRAFLETQKVTFTQAEFDAQKDWLKERIRWEMYYRAFDKNAAYRSMWAADPEIQKAIESLPKAQSLLNQATRVYAMKR
jgi:hypothetical protein